MIRAALSALLLLTLSACDSGGDDPEETASFSAQIILDGVGALDDAASYAAWANVRGVWTSVGTFNYDADGLLVAPNGSFISNTFPSTVDLAQATEFLVTIQLKGDAPTEPSDTPLLQGTIVDGVATLTHVGAVGSLSTVASDVVIATLSDDDPSNEDFGLWLARPTSSGFEAGMTAPVRTDGWCYTLWIDLNGVPTPLGSFADPSGRDDASPFSENIEQFALPGEDFLTDPPAGVTFPFSPAGSRTYVTLQPGTMASPFPFLLLDLQISGGASGGSVHAMQPQTDYPTGTVTLR